MWANTVAFGTGFAALAVFGPTMKKVTFAAIGKAFLASSPSLTGSLARLPFGPNIGRTGGKQWTGLYLFLCVLGITLNMILAFT